MFRERLSAVGCFEVSIEYVQAASVLECAVEVWALLLSNSCVAPVIEGLVYCCLWHDRIWMC